MTPETIEWVKRNLDKLFHEGHYDEALKAIRIAKDFGLTKLVEEYQKDLECSTMCPMK